MTTYRDLAEANAFLRRRLAAVWTSGSADGPRAEPPSSGRCLVGGVVLTAVIVATSGASSAVSGHPEVGWDHDGIHVSR